MRPTNGPLAALALSCALVAAACGGSSSTLPIVGGQGAYRTFQPALRVLGQADFVSNGPNRGGSAGAGTLDNAQAVIPSGIMTLAVDSANNRVLGWKNLPATNGADADIVIGQGDFTTTAGSTGIGNVDQPSGLAAGGGLLWLSEVNSNRVLGFNPSPTTTAPAAAIVLGQVTFVANGAQNPPGPNTLSQPNGLSATANVLVVADSLNNRVLLWTPLPAAAGAGATTVLGQPNMAGFLINQGTGTPSASGMAFPYGVWTDGTRVAVADLANHRVLLWNTLPTVDGQAADLVLGQASMLTATPGAGASGLRSPSDVTSDGTRLFVADCENNRILVWNAWPTTNAQPADVVLGQSDFTHTAANDDDQDGASDSTCSARTLNSAGGYLYVHAEAGRLYVGDRRNHRVLVFEAN
jgi:hypothetical protein